MPRFRLESEFSLIPALQRLGITDAFSDGADFSSMTEAAALQISEVARTRRTSTSTSRGPRPRPPPR
jgi:serine protease inhibitor